MHKLRSMKRAGALVVSLVLAASLFAVSNARAATRGCEGGVLANDAPGDDTYAGLDEPSLESTSADLISIATTLWQPDQAEGIVSFVTTVSDLGDTSPWHFDLRVRLDLRTDSGRAIVVDARRSSVTGDETATVDGVSDGVTAVFDNDANTITVTAAVDRLGDLTTLGLQGAETRYDSGAVLSPLADQAEGDCVLRLVPDGGPPGVSSLPVRALVIDTGVNGQHQEFADGQIFAWWDFSGHSENATPAAGATWQDRDHDGNLQGDRDDPYDPDGHGSATTSMLVGRNLIPAKTPSACPGCRVAVAKVLNEDAQGADGTEGVLDGSIADAIHWGVDTLDVDVISVSIGSAAPIPRFVLEDTYAAVTYARDHGVLVVFSNGNGWGNSGVPGQPGGFMNYGNSTDVLSVGADDDLYTYLVTTDPEVVAVFSVHAAAAQGTDEYQDISGTSFSAPFTAGVAARLIGEGRACTSDVDLGPDSIEQLIKYTARDRDTVPPTFEGYGVVDLATLQTALRVVCDGDDEPTPDPLSDFYVTNVSGTERMVSSSKLDSPVPMIETPFEDVSPHGALSTSVPTGPKDAEVFQVTLEEGQTLHVVAAGTGDQNDVFDFDMALFRGIGPDFRASDQLQASGNPGAVLEELSWTNTGSSPVTVSLVVYGWSIVGDQPFHLDGLGPNPTPVFDGYVVADHLVLSSLDA